MKSATPPRQAGGPKSTVGPRQNQEHLAEWMNRHRSLPLAQQHSALQNEPGFRQLPPQTQQRYLDRLTQLNNMPEEQRRRILERNEMMEIAGSRLEVREGPWTSYVALVFNTNQPPFNDVRVRRAHYRADA